jgi:hypothetical protein
MAKSQYSKKVLEIAAMLDVPKSTVEKIRRITNERPDLLEQIQAGDLSFEAADQIIWKSKQVIVFPLLDMKEAAIRMADAYDRGVIFRDSFDEFLHYLGIELDKIDKRHEQEFEEYEKGLIN